MNKRSNQNAFPKPYISQPSIVRKIRFIATSACNKDVIYTECLLSLLAGVSGTAQTAAAPLIVACRVIKVEIFGIASTSSETFTVAAIQWRGNQGSQKEINGVGNAMRPAHVSSLPPNLSTASFWLREGQTENQALFDITCDSGSIVDLTLEYIMQDGASAKVLTVTSSANGVYACPLDGLNGSGAAGSALLRPVSLTNIIPSART